MTVLPRRARWSLGLRSTLVASAAALIATTATTAGAASAAGSTTAADPPDLGDVINIGANRPAQFYDEQLAAGLADVEAMWVESFPTLYGEPFEPLDGGIYAAYPERVERIPGCGFGSDSSYQDVSDSGAFYCPIGDFIAFDDGRQGILYLLSQAYGDQVIPVVLAHEFGHAVQERINAFDDNPPTIYTEQQADCFAGAWSRRAWSGQSTTGVEFNDEDVLTGLRALHAVRDPIGFDLLDDGGHGSAFDRIGAYQTGFIGGLERCVSLLDTPLPLLPNDFTSTTDRRNEGNAPFSFESGGAIPIVVDHVSDHWDAAVAGLGLELPDITLRVVADPAADNCGQPEALVLIAAVYCVESQEVLFNEPRARELYDSYGDFAVGYVIGHAWADAAQTAIGSPLGGEARALVSDCLTGAWVATTLVDRPGAQEGAMTASPGDLDEAVLTAIQFGDAEFGTDDEGSAFEKIAYLRIGVIDGTEQCLTELDRLGTAPSGLRLSLPTS